MRKHPFCWSQQQSAGGGGDGGSPSLEEEMGLTGASADDTDADLMRRVCEEVGSSGLLSLFEPMIVSVVSNPSKFPCPMLQSSATLSLAKYMLIRYIHNQSSPQHT